MSTHTIISAYKAKKYCNYVISQENYNMQHRLSDLIVMLDNGIACNMFTQEELKTIIAAQDELTQKILIAQYAKHIIVE